MSLAPVVLFVYNRLDHTKKTIEFLQRNILADESELFIYSDAAKNEEAINQVNQVRHYIKSINGFKNLTIIEKKENLGLANSIINGVTDIINKYGKIIVLEDDLITSSCFLKFMNEALNFYENSNEVLSITGYNLPKDVLKFPSSYKEDIYMHIRPMSWSWATWKNRWDKVTWGMDYFDEFISNYREIKYFNKGGKDLTLMLLDQRAGNIDSWYIRWTYHAYKKQQYTIYPRVSFIQNLGFDDSGVHGSIGNKNKFFHYSLENCCVWKFKYNLPINKKIIKNFNKAFSPSLKTRMSLNFRLLTKIDKRLKN